jgi:protein-S-isoprenylcysteine O-methyltransferase Ste14
MRAIGRSTINPFLFYSGKIAGYICILAAFLEIMGISIVRFDMPLFVSYLAYALILLGITLIAVSIIHLGDSISIGVPSERTKLKTGGLYRYSRNPIYLGFNLLTVSSILISPNYIVAFLGVYSIVIYHFIIIGEEFFLRKRFGKKYEEYCRKVRRYI